MDNQIINASLQQCLTALSDGKVLRFKLHDQTLVMTYDEATCDFIIQKDNSMATECVETVISLIKEGITNDTEFTFI